MLNVKKRIIKYSILLFNVDEYENNNMEKNKSNSKLCIHCNAKAKHKCESCDVYFCSSSCFDSDWANKQGKHYQSHNLEKLN